ncbi:MAG: (2Fe-2S)-binding protein, partial [Rhodobacteraceae bacterium]|nr:(2Fe-2S)-binding protein [Paracoccaceae bacterium]
MRLSTGGLIDRDTRISFSFDGRTFQGYGGDTLASALLGNEVRLVARSFKYHRPRGIVTAGSEEPSALVTLGEGAAQTPNLRATMLELYPGLAARSQNRMLSLRHDLLAVNDLLAPFLGAGFYYKTFMWPPAFWERLYEPLIRRAAGLGALSGKPDEAEHERAFAFCDLLVIGAGPAGLMAALAAGRSGADVILADEDARPGGRMNAEAEEVAGRPAHLWAQEVLAELESLPNVRVMRRTTVTGAYDGGTYAALERVSEHLAQPPGGTPEACFWRIAARQAILATGALERGIAFPGNDRPGVMLAGAVRSYLHRHAVAAGRRVAVFTNNDDGWRTARDLSRQGIEATLVDIRPGALSDAGRARVITGGQVIATGGRRGLREVLVRTAQGEERLEVECLAVSGGWNPALQLSCHLGAR